MLHMAQIFSALLFLFSFIYGDIFIHRILFLKYQIQIFFFLCIEMTFVAPKIIKMF
jgi:hypothetical protein